MRGGVRLPLQIGTTSLWSMTRAALLLVPGVLLLPFGLVGGIGALYVGDGGEVGRDAAILQAVGADLDEHQRITKGSGMGSSEVRSHTVLTVV